MVYVCLWGGICLVNICRENNVYIRPCASCSVGHLHQHLKNETKLNLINATVQQVLAVWLESVPLLGFVYNILYLLGCFLILVVS